MSRQTAIYAFVVVAPFLIWGLVAAMARKDTQLLERIYPVARFLGWITIGATIVLLLLRMGDIIDRKILAIGASFQVGINLMHAWMLCRLEPDAKPGASEGGWWPTPKDY
jgi:hypothetical protein